MTNTTRSRRTGTLEPMPAGRVHEAINLGALGLLSASYLYHGDHLGVSEPAAFGFAAAYLIGTFLVTPDLDLAEQRVRAKGNWGVLGWLWVPYGLIFSHRGWSHTWIVGPLTRLAYMALMGALLWFGGRPCFSIWASNSTCGARSGSRPGRCFTVPWRGISPRSGCTWSPTGSGRMPGSGGRGAS